MTKTRSRIKIILTAVLIALGLFLTFGSFVLPTTNTTYRGFFNAINYGYDINGGRLAVYKVSDDNDDSALGNLSSKIDRIVGDYETFFSPKGMNVTRQGDNIRIEISRYDYDNISDAMAKSGFNADLFEIMGSNEGIKFTDQSTYSDVPSDALDGTYIDDCVILSSQAGGDGKMYYPVQITFNTAGQEKMRELSKAIVDEAGGLHIFVDGKDYLSSGLELSSVVSSVTLYSTSKNSAESLRLQVLALAKPLLLTKVLDSDITGSLNTSTSALFGNTKNMLIIALSAMLVAAFVYMLIRHRMLGLFGVMSILAFVCLFAFLLQSITLIVIDLAGLLGVLMTFGLLIAGMLKIFDRIEEEYNYGKRIPNSVSSAFRKNVIPTLERYGFLLILAVIVFLVGTPALKHFSFALFIGLFVNYFTLFVPFRGLCMLYTNINGTKKGYYNLKREAKGNE